MNKLICCLLLLLALPLFAQEESALELGEDGLVVNPLEATDEVAAPSEVLEPAPSESTPEVIEEDKTEANAEPEEKSEEVVVQPQTEENPLHVPAQVASVPAIKSELEVQDEKKFNPRKSHWVSTFGFESTKYEVVPKDYEFTGKKNFKNGFQELWGGRVGLGGEIYLGAGFITRSMVEGFYIGTLFYQILNGGTEASDVKFAFTKKTGQILGGDASQSLGWMFDFKTKNPFMDEWSYLTIETYVEAGIGKAWAYNRINYNYDTGTTPTSAQESYRLRIRDDLINARVGAGFNLTSNSGFFLALKATINRYDVTQRKIDGFTQPNGQATTPINETLKDAKIEPVVIYTLGGGYKF